MWRAPFGFRKRVGDLPLGAHEEDYPPVGQVPARSALEDPLSSLGNGEPPSPDYVLSSGSASPSRAPFGDGEPVESTPFGPVKESFAAYTHRIHHRVSLGHVRGTQKAPMTFGREQLTVAHRSGEDSSQSVTGASSTHSEAQKPACTKDDTCDLISNAEVSAQKLNEVSPSLRFDNVPVGVHVNPAEPPRRNSIIGCFTGHSGAPGGLLRNPSICRSGAGRDSGAIMRRFSFRWSKTTGDQNPVNHRQSMDRPPVESGAPDDLLRQEGINRSLVDA